MNDSRRVDPHRNRRHRFKDRARLEYLAGAEEEWPKRNGRPMTAEDLQRVLRRFPGDV